MKSLITVISIIVFSALSAYAAEGQLKMIEGKVRSFDKDTIRITTETAIVSVPRSYIPAEVKLQADASIKIPLTDEQMKNVKF